MMKTKALSKQEGQKRRRGFTLTEIAIVLGIIGLILGAIWVAASAVYTNLRNARAQNELLTITQNVRSMFATQSAVNSANGTDLTSALVTAGVFPSDTVSGATAIGPWGGSLIKVYSAQTTAVGDSFSVQFTGMPGSACTQLLTNVTGTGRDPGLMYAAGSTNTANAITTITPSTFPINAVTAAAACGSASTGASATFSFRLKG